MVTKMKKKSPSEAERSEVLERSERTKSRSAAKGNKYSGFESVMNSLSSGHHDGHVESGIFSVMGSKKKKEEI
jgi:hypothetical protein